MKKTFLILLFGSNILFAQELVFRRVSCSVNATIMGKPVPSIMILEIEYKESK